MSGSVVTRGKQRHGTRDADGPAPEARGAASHRGRLTASCLQRAAEASDPELRQRMLDRVMVLNMGVARRIASRFRRRGVALEDLEQVAYLALVRAVQDFDAGAGHDFLDYAVPTIRGELKKHFRDHGWMIRPPRRVQDLQAEVRQVRAELLHTLGRRPEVAEIAAELSASQRDVREAMAAMGCFRPASLDVPVKGSGGMTSVGETLGDPGRDGFDAAEARLVVGPLIRELGERDRRIVELRFFGQRTQQEIAEDIGVTQMQVSRLLSRILGTLRVEAGAAD
ncbi:MAG: sigma-70 family RNA polymerase sigma factor [Marmoricola sp.]